MYVQAHYRNARYSERAHSVNVSIIQEAIKFYVASKADFNHHDIIKEEVKEDVIIRCSYAILVLCECKGEIVFKITTFVCCTEFNIQKRENECED